VTAQLRSGSPLLDIVDAGVAAVGRAAGALSRLTNLGSGTSLPGRLVNAIDPGFLARRVARLDRGAVIVSGTNGKTTTASMLRSILQAEGLAVAANTSGANLAAGVVSAFLSARQDAAVGVLEIDEGALPSLICEVRPRLLVLTNVFRDQLDRFPEPEGVAARLRIAAERLPTGSILVANADDPLLWASLEELDPVGFSVLAAPTGGATQGGRGGASAPAFAADAEPESCPRCGAGLVFNRRTMAGLGSAHCDGCGWSSTAGHYVATLVSRAGIEASVLELCEELLTLPLGGIHNAYNAVAAVAAAAELGIAPHRAMSALEGFHPRFGRGEELLFDDRHLWLALIKNPAGAGSVIRDVCTDRRLGAVVVAISDRDADGRDVSWIWDAEFDRLVTLEAPLVAGGTRAADTAVRLKYAGRVPDVVEPDPLTAVRAATRSCPPDGLVAVLATYTAMLDIREALVGDRSTRAEDAVE